MKPIHKVFTLAVVAASLAAGVLAAEKVQGVKWSAKVTMQAKSFSMPERTLEVCLPATDPDQAAMEQGQQGNCKMSNFKRSGNKTSADMKCTGDRPSETHWEMQRNGDTMRGTMVTKTADNTINMTYDYTKVGGACEVQQAPAPGAMPKGATPQGLEEQQKRLKEMLGGA
jgi:hypothetical protein